MRKSRSKRLSKKLHKRFLYDIRYSISLSEEWRKKLFEAEDGTTFKIKQAPSSKLQEMIQKHKLRFCVMRKSIINSELIRFIFFPFDFPQIWIESKNPKPGSKEEQVVVWPYDR